MRIIQRFGRVDRIGSKNSVIQMVNFWPDISLDEYINLKERVENRMVIADLAATADDNLLTQESNDTKFRKEQLRRLQDEVIELEDVRTGVSITDLGLNDFRMDLLNYMEQYGDLASSPKGLHAAVPADPGRGPAPRRDLRAAQRRRADEDQPPQPPAPALPDLPRRRRQRRSPTTPRSSSCSTWSGRAARARTSRSLPAYHVFNQLTSEGAEMGGYSDLLNEAIRSLIDVTEQRDIDSLFSGTKTTALQQSFEGSTTSS